MRPLVINRSRWGAKYGLGSPDHGPEEMVVVHHTVAPAVAPGASLAQEARAVRQIEAFHVEERGWAGIGYNFLFTPNGTIYIGRGWLRAGAHAGSRADNFRSIGMCYVADGREMPLTPAAVEAVRWLIGHGVAEGHLAPSMSVVGHRDLKATECPGDLVYQQIDQLWP